MHLFWGPKTEASGRAVKSLWLKWEISKGDVLVNVYDGPPTQKELTKAYFKKLSETFKSHLMVMGDIHYHDFCGEGRPTMQQNFVGFFLNYIFIQIVKKPTRKEALSDLLYSNW